MNEIALHFNNSSGEINSDRDQMEFPVCNLCGANDSNLILEHCQDRLCRHASDFSIVQCSHCGLYYLSPRPTKKSISKFYSSYYTHQMEGWFRSSAADRLKSITKSILYAPMTVRYGKPVEKCMPFGKGVVLDVGCGNGSFLLLMRKRGWKTVGLDSDPAAAATARRLVPEARIYSGSLEETDLPEHSFSLIMASHVLEHVYSPVDFLKKCGTLLEKNGKLIIRVPNFTGSEASFFSKQWLGLDVPRHLYHFSPRTLTDMANKAGLRVDSIRPQVLPLFLSQSLINAFSDYLGFSVASSGITAKILTAMCCIPPFIMALLGDWHAIELVATIKTD